MRTPGTATPGWGLTLLLLWGRYIVTCGAAEEEAVSGTLPWSHLCDGSESTATATEETSDWFASACSADPVCFQALSGDQEYAATTRASKVALLGDMVSRVDMPTADDILRSVFCADAYAPHHSPALSWNATADAVALRLATTLFRELGYAPCPFGFVRVAAVEGFGCRIVSDETGLPYSSCLTELGGAFPVPDAWDGCSNSIAVFWILSLANFAILILHCFCARHDPPPKPSTSSKGGEAERNA